MATFTTTGQQTISSSSSNGLGDFIPTFRVSRRGALTAVPCSGATAIRFKGRLTWTGASGACAQRAGVSRGFGFGTATQWRRHLAPLLRHRQLHGPHHQRPLVFALRLPEFQSIHLRSILDATFPISNSPDLPFRCPALPYKPDHRFWRPRDLQGIVVPAITKTGVQHVPRIAGLHQRHQRDTEIQAGLQQETITTSTRCITRRSSIRTARGRRRLYVDLPEPYSARLGVRGLSQCGTSVGVWNPTFSLIPGRLA